MTSIIKIDNFALSQHNACPKKYEYRILQGWTPKQKASALDAGAALHNGLASWYTTSRWQGLTTEQRKMQAVASITQNMSSTPTHDWRDRGKVVETMLRYIEEYPREQFQVLGDAKLPHVEVTFAHVLTDLAGNPVHTDKGRTIIYSGIFDTLVEWAGQIYILEHKTTSRLDSYYFDQYKPNNQVDGYVWAASQLTGRPVAGAIINAIGWHKTSRTKFERRITSRIKPEIATWITNIQASASEIEWNNERKFFSQRKDSCITKYGPCAYRNICILPTEEDRERMLRTDYVIEMWEPTERTDTADATNA